jgi:antitoxin component YwqK of YwqJK toxin-antitoxin module
MKKDIVNKNENNQLHGIQIEYYYNGKIMRKWNYINGNPHGEHIVYYRNGQIMYKHNYINGEKVSKGEWIDYNRKLKMKMMSNL